MSVVTRWHNIFSHRRKCADPWTPAERAQKTDLVTILQHFDTHDIIDSMAILLHPIDYRITSCVR